MKKTLLYLCLGITLGVVSCKEKPNAQEAVTPKKEEAIKVSPLSLEFRKDSIAKAEQENVLAAEALQAKLEDEKYWIKEDVTSVNKFSLDSFTQSPPEIDGCSCYFSRNKADYKAGRYIYKNDYAQTCFLSINGKLAKFIVKKEGDSISYDSPYIDLSGQYEVRTEVTSSTPSGEETSLTKGIITVKNLKNKVTKQIPFVGECGC